ncbi:hypothetical protein C8Q79DRAFT_986851 [Trametes meyenii]|nr:hypothetical protein C8Q79DRAFT_986851 [Trametes meyenii]
MIILTVRRHSRSLPVLPVRKIRVQGLRLRIPCMARCSEPLTPLLTKYFHASVPRPDT